MLITGVADSPITLKSKFKLEEIFINLSISFLLWLVDSLVLFFAWCISSITIRSVLYLLQKLSKFSLPRSWNFSWLTSTKLTSSCLKLTSQFLGLTWRIASGYADSKVLIQLSITPFGHEIKIRFEPQTCAARMADNVLPVPVPLKLRILLSLFSLNANSFCINFGSRFFPLRSLNW